MSDPKVDLKDKMTTLAQTLSVNVASIDPATVDELVLRSILTSSASLSGTVRALMMEINKTDPQTPNP